MNKACSGIWLLSVAGAISPIAAFAVTANNAYGLTGWASMLELAPAITNKHPNKSEFQSGQNFPPSKIHRVDWDCGH